jgi:hypothetical protein
MKRISEYLMYALHAENEVVNIWLPLLRARLIRVEGEVNSINVTRLFFSIRAI